MLRWSNVAQTTSHGMQRKGIYKEIEDNKEKDTGGIWDKFLATARHSREVNVLTTSFDFHAVICDACRCHRIVA